jgi:hypothetical protein
MVNNGLKQEAFAEYLRGWCPCVERALDLVPDFDPAWEQIAHEKFQDTFQAHISNQTTLPSLSLNPAGVLRP